MPGASKADIQLIDKLLYKRYDENHLLPLSFIAGVV